MNNRLIPTHGVFGVLGFGVLGYWGCGALGETSPIHQNLKSQLLSQEILEITFILHEISKIPTQNA